jgi:hypothetical protein
MPLFLILRNPEILRKIKNENIETKVIHWQTVLKKIE